MSPTIDGEGDALKEKKKAVRARAAAENNAVNATEAVRDDSRTFQQQGRGDILSDVLGSYTGSPESGEVPEQDADDL